MRVVVAGSLVDVSTTISPWRAPLAMPSAPRITSSTCGAPVTHSMTISALRASSAWLAASVAPAARRSSRGARLRCTRSAHGVALGDQVLRDAMPHQADADEADSWFAHAVSPPRWTLRNDRIGRARGKYRSLRSFHGQRIERTQPRATALVQRDHQPAARDDAHAGDRRTRPGNADRQSSRPASPRRAACR